MEKYDNEEKDKVYKKSDSYKQKLQKKEDDKV
jgi:hypothetical protein